jgi:iron complex outermembrane recepter protein
VLGTNLKNCVAKPTLKYSILWGALACVMGLPLHAETVQSSNGRVEVGQSLKVSAGPLAATLREIARQSGVAIQYESYDVRDLQAPEISGAMTATQAVQQAIATSGLSLTTLPNGAIQILPHRLGLITLTAAKSEAEEGFKASRSSTATRSGAELKEVPQAITVVTAKVIETQQAQSVQELLQNVAGVVTRESAQGVAGYQVRGFSQTGALSNGISNPYSSMTNVAGIDRVEVLKGPAAILSGGDSLSGAVNIVSKKPRAERIRDLSLSYGSHQDKRVTVDVGDAITDDEKLSFRVVGSVARADHNDAGYDGRESDYLLSALRWKNDATDITVGLSYDEMYAPQNRYTFGLGGIKEIPSILLGNKDDGINLESKAVFYDAEHIVNDWLTVVSRMQYTDTVQDLDVWGTRYPMDTANMLMALGNSNNLQKYKTLSGDHYLRFNVDTAAVNHKLSVGINHTKGEAKQTEYSGSTLGVSVYGNSVQFPDIRVPNNLWSIYESEYDSKGYFIQDLMTWGDFHFLVGARKNTTKYKPSSTTYPNFNNVTLQPAKERETSRYNLGLVYDITTNTSAYVSYSEGFLPQIPSSTLCSGGNDFPDMETKNQEIGLKGESRDGALSWGVAAYQLDQANVLEPNRVTWCYEPREAARVRGVELETSGRILPGLNVTFNYSYNNTKDRVKAENVPGAQPDHQASLWTTYDFQREALKGFGLSFGVTAFSDSRLGYSQTDVMVPGGARFDLGASYTHNEDWSLRLGVKNVFDTELYGFSGSALYLPVLEGRNATLTFKYSF